jgi:hypothetical protein
MANGAYPYVPKDWNGNLDFRMRVLEACGRSRSARQQFADICADDILFYLNTFGVTYDPRRRGSRIPFLTYPFQDEVVLDLVDAVKRSEESRVDVAIAKSRDMGASWMLLAVQEWFFHFHPGNSFLLVSRNEDYVDAAGNPKSLFWKIDYLHRNQPRWLRPDVKRTSMHMENRGNGSVIDGESTTGEVARGDRRTAITLDEFGAFDLNAGFAAMASTLSATNCRFINSTPRGSANAFYKVCHEMAAKVIRLHWSRHPLKNQGLYTAERADERSPWKLKLLDGWTGLVEVRQKASAKVRKVRYPDDYPFILDGKLRSPWYDNEAKSCTGPAEIAQELDIDFMGSDCQFFDGVTIETYKRLYCREPVVRGELPFDHDTYRPLDFTATKDGLLWLWANPARDGGWERGEKFVLGADVSAGTGASNSCVVGYRRDTGEKICEYANSKIEPPDFARFCLALARWLNNAHMVFDRSGPTGEVFYKTIRDRYGNFYYQEKRKDNGVEKQPGVWLNPQVKAEALEKYRDSIGRAAIVNRSERAVSECLSFIRTMNGAVEHSAALNTLDPGGARAAHGDLVVADALANMGLSADSTKAVSEEPEVPEDSVAGRMAEYRRKLAEESGDALGEGWD